MFTYTLNTTGITFFFNGMILFDCPIERIEHDPESAIKAFQMLEEFWKRKKDSEDP